MWSYFWNSETHLYILQFWVELTGCAIEIGIAFAAWLTLHKGFTEVRKRTLEKQIAALGIVAAVFVLVVVLFSYRVSQMQEIRIAQEIQQVSPKPLPVRLRTLLASIDLRILIALKKGTTHFQAGLTTTQLADLQRIAAEPDGSKFLSMPLIGPRVYGGGPHGEDIYSATFTLAPALLDLKDSN